MVLSLSIRVWIIAGPFSRLSLLITIVCPNVALTISDDLLCPDLCSCVLVRFRVERHTGAAVSAVRPVEVRGVAAGRLSGLGGGGDLRLLQRVRPATQRVVRGRVWTARDLRSWAQMRDTTTGERRRDYATRSWRL